MEFANEKSTLCTFFSLRRLTFTFKLIVISGFFSDSELFSLER